ncbi:helix-hairpin-helix domain-containing protein [Paludibacter jiangxiensis]|uniref:Helix-hairpin-helix motif-containing protein n=1 Tax=Paludibacter jiangxiensis TaxID=681398 RepID=A0A171A634_9BACT|nr:helix-hairpin-helix domain-containing protein [Paludibacter jiangxiensis]GAT63320.1 helix-hairpin-helix motif-containing protein [Paludibacter jiangxiensis]
MKMRRVLFVMFFIYMLCFGFVLAQDKPENTAAVIERIYEQMTSDGEADVDLTTLEDDLNYFARNPININNTNKEELEKLQFLSDKQIENFLYYMYRQKRMQTIYELQLVDGFDMFLIRNLLPFVYLGDSEGKKGRRESLSKMLRDGINELYIRSERTLEKKSGYENTMDNAGAEATDKRYLGGPEYLSLKYSFRYKDKIDAGLIGETDAGEQVWGQYHKGFDFYSGYLQLANFGKLKTLVVGNFRANFGMGLVIHPELNFGKSTDIMNVLPRNSGLRKSSSVDEYNFLRGTGVTLRFGKAEVSGFYSYRFIDGDSAGNTFSSIKTDGLHRTLSDLNRKNVISMQVFGGNVNYRFSNANLGITVTDTRLGRDFQPDLKPYNVFYFRGNHQLAAGLNYRFKWNKFTFFGEEATQSAGGYAILNGFTVCPVSTVSFVVLYRLYSKQYDVLLSNAFAEGSKVNNEEGFYLGFEVHPVKRWKITGYMDVYSFPWLRYLVSRPSDGYDAMLEADFLLNKKVEMLWRIRYEQKEKNQTGSETADFTDKYTKASLRYKLLFSPNERCVLKSTIETNSASGRDSELAFGFLFAQELSCSFRKLPLSFDVRYELFDAVNYENRIYSYERDILYAYSVPMLYGRGSRWYLNCRWQVSKNISLWMKVAESLYADRSEVGDGLEKIVGNHKTDVRAMIRFRF